ncbi:DUF1643 domain-containing protein [Microbacterium sp. bgisy189]|uniref:DUF1643 domain-containing protein n=1 Tax=Microbacterium sp. bgisy189 TaxID=3413798 RepID=UPI003EB71CC0
MNQRSSDPDGSRRLVAVLSNPPSETDGSRTLSRVQQASAALGTSTIDVVNLFSLPTYRSDEISRAGVAPESWLSARPTIAKAIERADAVLLAYGISEPTGIARDLHREQVRWLTDLLRESGLPVYVVGDGPRHPTRWQRYTTRHFQHLSFGDALRQALVAVSRPPAT